MLKQICVLGMALFAIAASQGTSVGATTGLGLSGVTLADGFDYSLALANVQPECVKAAKHTLPLPTTVPPAQFVAFEQQVLDFLNDGEYLRLGWCGDKGIRDTGPWRKGVYYGTHPAVRVYYSPEAMQWLTAGRKGAIPDGAMIIKEQYPPPAARYASTTGNATPKAADWTVMIKDSKGSKDGWFWGEFYVGMSFDDDQPPFNYPNAGFGLYCLRCHASAQKQLTFSSLDNVAGFPGKPIAFPDDGTWKTMGQTDDSQHGQQPPQVSVSPTTVAAPALDPEFARVFNAIPPVAKTDVKKFPSETYDHIVPNAQKVGQFITSDQCMNCHAGLNGPFGPIMFLPTGPAVSGVTPGANVSPYGEWRWSPMGLAGRDPIFFSQIETELAYIETLTPPARSEEMRTTLVNTCMRCHGVMGKRQFDQDQPPGSNFQLAFTGLTDRSDPNFKYGALARDGVSCAACHRTEQDDYPANQPKLKYFLENSITGLFETSPKPEVFGQFKNHTISRLPMRNGLGITPRFSRYISSSRQCGSCHTINLPVVDGPAGAFEIEQATYLEWLNSQYQDEFGPRNAKAKTCQDCHMPGDYHSADGKIDVARLKQKIAIIEDNTYPDADHRAPDGTIRVRTRQSGFARHTFLGLNVLLLEMFGQMNDVLGVRLNDYMSGSADDLPNAIDNFVEQAQNQSATIELSTPQRNGQQIATSVKVTNLTGHRLPSGVGFRRAFIELSVLENRDGQEQLVWSSGRTNGLGILVDADGRILPSEFFTEYRDDQGQARQHYQPHYRTISAEDQVQVYEELVQNADGQFTSSFIRRDKTIKDNRLLPIGWTKQGPDSSLSGKFLAATYPEGDAANDGDYADGKGSDTVTYAVTLPAGVDPAKCRVTATLYYQSVTPAYLQQRFAAAPDGDATKRLYYLASNLNLKETPLAGWKLRLVSVSAPVP